MRGIHFTYIFTTQNGLNVEIRFYQAVKKTLCLGALVAEKTNVQISPDKV